MIKIWLKASFFVLIVVIDIVLYTSAISRAETTSESDVPYIYYYSNQRNAFITEGANGDDSHILINYSLPNDGDWIYGPGWSRSTQWFAWYSSGIHSEDSDIHVVNSNGQEHTTIPVSGDIRTILWSPVDDILLVQQTLNQTTTGEEVYLFEMQSRSIITRLDAAELTGLESGANFYRIGWSPDGTYIVLHYPRYDSTSNQTVDSMTLLSIDGNRIDFASQIIGQNCQSYTAPYWINTEQIVYLDSTRDMLIIYNTTEENGLEIETPENLTRVDWDADGSHAFLFTVNIEREFSYSLWLLSVDKQSIDLLSEEVQLPNCLANWYPQTAWSRNGNYGIFLSEDGDIFLVDIESLEITEATKTMNGQVPSNSPIWWTEDSTAFIFIWFSLNEGEGIYQYNIASPSEIDILVHPADISQSNVGYIAPLNRNYLAYSGKVIDLFTNLVNEFELQNSIYSYDIGIYEMLWHPTSDWLFTLGFVDVPLRLVNVANVDASIQRELGNCPVLSKSCFGWLPDTTN